MAGITRRIGFAAAAATRFGSAVDGVFRGAPLLTLAACETCTFATLGVDAELYPPSVSTTIKPMRRNTSRAACIRCRPLSIRYLLLPFFYLTANEASTHNQQQRRGH